MDEFAAIATNFPTVIFSAALIVVCVFWLLAIIGVADIELMDLDVEISSETDASGFGNISGLLMKYGLAGIPITVIISLLVLLSWFLCYFGSAYLLSWLPGSVLKFLGGVVLIGVCVAIAFPITASALRPMKDMFVGETAPSNKDFVGSPCEVRSGEVTASFGQGQINDGGAGLLLDIRAAEPNDIKRGDIVAITSYDETTNTYSVIPESEFMGL